MDAEERTERMIHQIDALVASSTLHKTRKRFVLNEFVGQLVGHHSVNLTGRRCQITDKCQLEDREWYIELLFRSVRERAWSEGLKSDRMLLHQAIRRARKNGWTGGESILDTLTDGRPFDAGYVLRGLLNFDCFLEGFWQGENLAKHRLGLTLFDDPLTYVRIYV